MQFLVLLLTAEKAVVSLKITYSKYTMFMRRADGEFKLTNAGETLYIVNVLINPCFVVFCHEGSKQFCIFVNIPNLFNFSNTNAGFKWLPDSLQVRVTI